MAQNIFGFSNTRGGCLIIGVKDQTLNLVGFNKAEAESERNFLNNLINETCTPPLRTTIDFIEYTIRNKNRFIIQLTVNESNVKPVILTHKGVPSIYMRRDGFTNGATPEEIIQMSISSHSHAYDRVETSIQFNLNDFSTFSACYSRYNENKPLTKKLLSSIGFFNKDECITKGAELFLDHYGGVDTQILCSVFSGFTKGSERLVTMKTIKTNICDSIDLTLEFIKQRMNQTIIKHSCSHELLDAFPSRALLEGVINAIAHRDYYLQGTQINIYLFKDRLEMSSPGSFYQHNELPKTYDLSKVISNRRNQLICDVLVKCKVMEATGTGFDKIIEEYKKADSHHQPYVYSTSSHFTLVLPDLTYENGIDLINPIQDLLPPISNESKYDKKILNFCLNSAKSSKEIADELAITISTYFRNSILENLVKQKLLSKKKIGVSFYYYTTLND